MGTVRYYWKKYIWNLPFMAAALVMGLAYYKLAREILLGKGFMILEGLNLANAVKPVVHFVPVMACLPYAMKFYEERNSGSYQYAILRAGRKRYAVKRVSEAALSGALVMLSALLIYSLLICGEAAAKGIGITFEGATYEDGIIYKSWIEGGFGIVVYFVAVSTLTLQGAVWACFGTVVGMFTRNRRLAVVGPFFLELVIGMPLPDSLAFLNPHELNFTYWTMIQPLGGIPHVLIYTTVTVLSSMIIVYFGMKRFMGR